MPDNYNHEPYEELTQPDGHGKILTRKWPQWLTELWYLRATPPYERTSISILLPDAIFRDVPDSRARNSAFRSLVIIMAEFNSIVLLCARLLLASNEGIRDRGKWAIETVTTGLQGLRRQLELQHKEYLASLPPIERTSHPTT